MHDMRSPTLLGQCLAEFIGTALLIFFGTGCVAALVVGGAFYGCGFCRTHLDAGSVNGTIAFEPKLDASSEGGEAD